MARSPQLRSRRRPAQVAAAAIVVGLLAAWAGPARAAAPAGQPPAPQYPGTPADWSPGDKDGFGTAIDAPNSKVWYTLRNGTLSEVYAPRIDTESSRDTQLVVSDGKTFADLETTATTQRIELVDPRALVYRQVDTARSGKYRITKTYVTDPARSTVLAHVQVESLTGQPYAVYVLHDVGLGLNANDDLGRSGRGGLLAGDGTQASAVLVSSGFTKTSSGYAGTSDGLSDLSDFSMDWSYDATRRGNVVQLGQTRLTGLPGAQWLTLALGFGATEDEAADVAQASLARGYQSAKDEYSAGWHRYLDGLRPVPQSARAWATDYDVSLMVLAASEDKTYRGGFVASPGRPWAWANSLQQLPVYHEVWSRDQYQIATALLAGGDRAAARRALNYLWDVQQRADGSFPQNSRLSGEAVFGGLQLDEVSLPIVLTWQLGATDADWPHVRAAADFVVANGPSTPQERWENTAGWSPATIAAEIAGLVTAADIARAHGATAKATQWLATADQWQRSLGTYAVTTNGPLSSQPYYLRITANGNANTGAQIQVGDGGPLVDQRKVVDPSFLELVRLGVVPADDPAIRSTLPVIDSQLSYVTPNGRFWHRASFDGYGEQRDGTEWESTPNGSGLTLGRGWPLLSGERGEYELAAGQSAQGRLDTMARAADDQSHFMAEQVWDYRAPATASDPALRPGEPTRSATPLAWTHAEFVRLAQSIDAGRPVETPTVVACRYGSSLCTTPGA